MIAIEETPTVLKLTSRANGWLRLFGWSLVSVFGCAVFGSAVPFFPPHETSLACDRSTGKCTFTDRRPTELAVKDLLAASAGFHKTGGRTNRQYLHHVTVKVAGEPRDWTLCDAPDDDQDRDDDRKIAAEIERFIHEPEVPTLSVKCDVGRTSIGTLIAAVINGLLMIVFLYWVMRVPIGSRLEIDKGSGDVTLRVERLALTGVTTRTTLANIESVRTREVMIGKKAPIVRHGAVLIARDGLNLVVLRMVPTWSPTANQRADAGKRIAAFLNVPAVEDPLIPG